MCILCIFNVILYLCNHTCMYLLSEYPFLWWLYNRSCYINITILVICCQLAKDLIRATKRASATYWLSLLIRLTTTFTITSFSSVRRLSSMSKQLFDIQQKSPYRASELKLVLHRGHHSLVPSVWDKHKGYAVGDWRCTIFSINF